MVMLNPNTRDPYHLIALTDAISQRPYIPDQLEQWLPWNSQGEISDILMIEFMKDGTLSLIAEAARGTLGEQIAREIRSEILIKCPYYPQFETLLAGTVRNVRAFGSEDTTEGYSIKLNELLDRMKRKNALMREFIRAGALQGIIYKKDGNVSQNLWNLFDVQQNTASIDLSNATTDIVGALIDAKESVEDELGDMQGLATSYKLICGKNIFKRITRHAKIQKDYGLWSATAGFGNQGSILRDDMRSGFPIASDIDVVSYSKGKVGSTAFIDPDTALLCPVISGLYQTRYAPGDGKQVVNTIGLPEYASMKELDFDKGDQIHTEMSTVSFLERPRAVVKITSPN